jgi:hypothetical protein
MLSTRASPALQRAGVRATPPPAFMSFDAYCRLVDGFVPPLELHLQGADEPLLHPRVFDMVAYATQRGLDVCATTRMPGLTAKRAEECVQSGLRRMHVLLERDPSGLVRRSLARLEEAKRRLGSKLPEVMLVDAAPVLTPATHITFSGRPALLAQ